MRFVVLVDLIGTIVLPATTGYLAFLIYTLIKGGAAGFPVISLIMLAAVYGLQAFIFIVKRNWQHIGWMILYLLAYPVYSLLLPCYAFWCQDDFSWGSTRTVVSAGKELVICDDDPDFDIGMIPLETWKAYWARLQPVVDDSFEDVDLIEKRENTLLDKLENSRMAFNQDERLQTGTFMERIDAYEEQKRLIANMQDWV